MKKHTGNIMLDIAGLNAQFEQEAPQDILAWAAETLADRFALVTSFQPSGLVLTHMLGQIAPHAPIITLDTGLLFPETYALMAQYEREYGITIQRVSPAQTVAEQAGTHGDALWARDPDACCGLRKVAPLRQALTGYEAWITGVRRDQSASRRNTPILAWDTRHNNLKLAPLAAWTEDMVWTYIHAYALPYNLLHDQGYASIGCQPCTRAVAPGEDKRAGRWSGQNKVECGIHLPEVTTPSDARTV
jgi:phosphoadenosine phosphosulfate reductase